MKRNKFSIFVLNEHQESIEISTISTKSTNFFHVYHHLTNQASNGSDSLKKLKVYIVIYVELEANYQSYRSLAITHK